MAVASAGPYINNLHLAPDRLPHQHLIMQFLQARWSSWRPTKSVKTPKAQLYTVCFVQKCLVSRYWKQYLCCCCLQEFDSLHTDIILAGRNAVFLQLVSSSLLSQPASLNNVVPNLYKQQPDLLHLESVSSITENPSDTGDETAWQSQYVIRIPAGRQDESQKSIRTGSDVLSTAMRYIYYGSTDLLS